MGGGLRPLLRPGRLSIAADWCRRATAPEQGAGAARAHGPKILAAVGRACQAAARASAPGGNAVALVAAPSPAPKAGLCPCETGICLAVRALPVAWPTFGAVALAVTRRPPLRRRPPAARTALIRLCRRLRLRALAASSMAALKRREASQDCAILGLGWTTTLAIARHGPSRNGRWALRGVVGTQRPRRLGKA